MPAAAATATVAAAVVVLGRLGSATSSPPALGERKESEAAIEALSLFLHCTTWSQLVPWLAL